MEKCLRRTYKSVPTVVSEEHINLHLQGCRLRQHVQWKSKESNLKTIINYHWISLFNYSLFNDAFSATKVI
jgi:hypothetical protein